MKKITLLLSVTLLSIQLVSAQNLHHGIGVHFGAFDFYGPQAGKYFASDKFDSKTRETNSRFKWDPTIRVSYWHAFTKHIDLNASINVSSLQYPLSKKDSSFIKMKNGTSNFKSENAYATLDVRANYNLLSREEHLISPYISTGLSLGLFETNQGIDIPVGVGANLRLANDIYLNASTDYRMAISKVNQNHLMHSMGLVYWFGARRIKAIPPPTPPAPPVVKIVDLDNDGVPDKDDACPTIAGKKELKGCPDRDNDGIEDGKDKCPDVKGLTKYEGCPMPDRDKDGFADELDKCPDVASITNNGCPEIKAEVKEKVAKAAKGVFFESGSAKITKASFVNLNAIVDILKADETLQVEIEGHTDNKGNADKNLTLSQQRADACGAYLIQKGIAASRISSMGFGDLHPIGDNKTEEGRALNRRTEFLLKN